MYVCICNQVTESDIHEAVAGGATSMGQLSERLGVAGCCGTCDWQAREILDDALSNPALVRDATLSDCAA